MALFRRRSARDEVPAEDLRDGPGPAGEPLDEAYDDPDDGYDDLDGADERAAAPPVPEGVRADGPYDESEADLADPDLPRLDLGSLLIPGLPGVGVQVEADQSTGDVRAVTAVLADAGVQLQAFAAPRSEGLWDELREEMLAELTGTPNAKVSEHDGPFGPELRAILPARTPEGQQVLQALRFTGIDGPRWFLRAVFLGRAAVEPQPDDVLHTLVRQTIVVRGGDAMAPRDALPLRLPEQPPAGMAEAGGGEPGEEAEDLVDGLPDEDDDVPNRYADLDPFERGPEITEIR
jgi:hypothetical protein